MRFLVCDVLGQAERRVQIPLGKRAQRLPEVLSRGEVAALLEAPMSCKARTLLMTADASGLRLNELCHLRGCDIEPTRYGRRRKPGLRYSVQFLSPGLRRPPPRSA